MASFKSKSPACEHADKTLDLTKFNSTFSFSMSKDDWVKFDAVVSMAREYVERYSPGLEIDREAVDAMSKVSDDAIEFLSENIEGMHK